MITGPKSTTTNMRTVWNASTTETSASPATATIATVSVLPGAVDSKAVSGSTGMISRKSTASNPPRIRRARPETRIAGIIRASCESEAPVNFSPTSKPMTAKVNAIASSRRTMWKMPEDSNTAPISIGNSIAAAGRKRKRTATRELAASSMEMTTAGQSPIVTPVSPATAAPLILGRKCDISDTATMTLASRVYCMSATTRPSMPRS
ncbi:hypothetical protein D3C71_1389700 [compost metagenome]